MDEVCIVCNRAIEWPPKAEGDQAGGLSTGASVNAGEDSGHIQPTHSSTAVGKANGPRNKGIHVAAHPVPTAKIRRNHSSGKLSHKGKSTLRPLSITTPHPPSTTPQNHEDDGDENPKSSLLDWMTIYCSEECKQEDELRSRLAFANLNDERNKHFYPHSVNSLPVSRSAAYPSSYVPFSSIAHESEEHELDWSTANTWYRSNNSGGNAKSMGSRDSSEFGGSRRYSDGSDSSRLSVASRPRRTSSRTRESTDSLASMGGIEFHQDNRPEMPHRSSARSSGLRAMTPIHYTENGSPRDYSPPVRIAGPPDEKLPPSAMLIRSNSDFVNGVNGNVPSTLVSLPASVKTYRPASLGRPGLRPSKSSATLAISSGEDVRATIASEYETMEHYPHQSTSYKQPSVPKYHATMPPRHTHRPHTSSSSIPYLSCSPSSPGSISLNSARSIASTAPSSHFPLGEVDDAYSTDPRKSKYVDERIQHASLTSYGLFHQRTPSTPSLTSLANSSLYGRSPPISRSTRLSSSYDTMISGGTVSNIMRAQQAATRNYHLTQQNGSSSPRRSTFDVNSHAHLHPGGISTRESTPTQSVSTTRSPSFVASRLNARSPAHEIVHLSTDSPGRPRAPSITRTDLERIPSDRSIASSSALGAGRRQPSHLRPVLHHHTSDGSDASGSSPPSPGLPTPGRDERPSYHRRHPSHPAINQLQNEEYALHNSRPLTANARSKSRGSFNRSSFTWDHLPSYVPQYTAMDLDKVRRNKSGPNLLSSFGEEGHSRPQPEHANSQETIKRPSTGTMKKRLFYFPDDTWYVRIFALMFGPR